MPEPPSVGLITRYVLENPWPLALMLGIVAVALGWSALMGGRLRRLPAAVLLAATALGVVLTGLLVKTSGERGSALVRSFVEAMVQEDDVAAVNLMAANATVSFDSPRNPGHDLTYIKSRLKALFDQYSIDTNRITHLEGHSEAADHSVVHLTCWTDAGYGPIRSRWVLRTRRRSDGTWAIDRITCISIGERSASGYR